MEKVIQKKNAFYFIGLISGILAILSCIASIGLAVGDSYYSIYTLATGLVFLGVNRTGLHLSNFKKNMFEHIFLTVFIFVLATLVALTKFGIYFLIVSMFLYSLTIVVYRILKIREDHSPQSIVFNILCAVFSFLFSFLFFFPAIYAKHATSISNSNFIIFCYALMIIVSSSKNLIYPYYHKLRINIVSNIIRKSLVYEIILSLLILVLLCSIYFTIAEPDMESYVDALWYSFSVITTIGFGDVYVTTTFGRILSVILGICGIAVVAVFTSFIVNFYNEANKRRVEKQMNSIIEKVEEIEKTEEEKTDK